MNIAQATVAASIIAALAGLLVMWRSNRLRYEELRRQQAAATTAAATVAATAATQVTDRLIDQLQEERQEIKASLSTAHSKIDALDVRQRHWEDYTHALRAHIDAGQPPPPPAYPPALLRERP